MIQTQVIAPIGLLQAILKASLVSVDCFVSFTSFSPHILWTSNLIKFSRPVVLDRVLTWVRNRRTSPDTHSGVIRVECLSMRNILHELHDIGSCEHHLFTDNVILFEEIRTFFSIKAFLHAIFICSGSQNIELHYVALNWERQSNICCLLIVWFDDRWHLCCSFFC